MAKFCPECGKKLKSEAKFCSLCGVAVKPALQSKTQTQSPAAASASSLSSPSPPKNSGCKKGCLIGCLAFVLVNLLILGLLIGGGWWLINKIKAGKDPGSYFGISSASKKEKTVDCGSSAGCLETELKKCSPAEGKLDINELIKAEFQVLGISGDNADFCVIYFKITEIKEMPKNMENLPSFVLEKLLKDLSMECLVPESIYKQGIDKTGEYVGENMSKICKGSLFDIAEKFGIDLEN